MIDLTKLDPAYNPKYRKRHRGILEGEHLQCKAFLCPDCGIAWDKQVDFYQYEDFLTDFLQRKPCPDGFGCKGIDT